MGSPAAGRLTLISPCGLGVPGSSVSMCTDVHVCAVHMQPLAPPVCACGQSRHRPRRRSAGGEGTEGNLGEPEREGTGGANPDPQEGPGGATRSRATCITPITPKPPPPVSPQLLPRQQEEPGASPGTASPSCCPCAAGDRAAPEGGRRAGIAHATVTPPSLQATPMGEPPAPPGAWAVPQGSNVPLWHHCSPLQWDLSLHRGTAGSRGNHGTATELTGPHHCPPDLTKGAPGQCPAWPTQAHAHTATGLVLSHMWQ